MRKTEMYGIIKEWGNLMLLAIGMMVLIIYFILGVYGTMHNPVEKFSSLDNGMREHAGHAQRVFTGTLYTSITLLSLSILPVLLHHFVVERVPTDLFIAVVLFTLWALINIAETDRHRKMDPEGVRSVYLRRAIKFTAHRTQKATHYGSGILFNLLKAYMIFRIVQIIF